jgi:hypothetical protein
METQGREETDHAMGHALGSFDQTVVLGNWSFLRNVNSATHAIQQAPSLSNAKILARDAIPGEVARTDDAGSAGEPK